MNYFATNGIVTLNIQLMIIVNSLKTAWCSNMAWLTTIQWMIHKILTDASVIETSLAISISKLNVSGEEQYGSLFLTRIPEETKQLEDVLWVWRTNKSINH